MTTHSFAAPPHRLFRIASAASLPFALTTALAPDAAVAAQSESARNCTITIRGVTVDPPIGVKPGSGVFHSTRQGVVDCGNLKGTALVDGRFGIEKPASCATGGDGWGVLRVRLGKENFGDTFTAKFGPNARAADTGNTRGERVDSSFVFLGTKGDCVTSPVSVGTLTMRATIGPAR